MKLSTVVVAFASIWAVEGVTLLEAVAGLNSVSELSQNLTTSLDNTRSPEQFAQTLVSGYKTIVAKVYDNANALGQSKATQTKPTVYDSGDQIQLCAVFKSSASTFQNLVDTTAEKSAQLKSSSLGTSMGKVLQDAEFAESNYAHALVGVAPKCAPIVKSQMQSLMDSLVSAAKVFYAA